MILGDDTELKLARASLLGFFAYIVESMASTVQPFAQRWLCHPHVSQMKPPQPLLLQQIMSLPFGCLGILSFATSNNFMQLSFRCFHIEEFCRGDGIWSDNCADWLPWGLTIERMVCLQVSYLAI